MTTPSSKFVPLFSDPTVSTQICHIEEWSPRSAAFGDIPADLHPLLRQKLHEGGIDRLYSHQAQAFDSFSNGSDFVVTTGTNSGKTLCYHLPTLQKCLTEPGAKALFLFPTKALAQDQLKRLLALNPAPNIRAGTYDGDTPKAHRSLVRRTCDIVITNPDMLHVGILPSHENWSRFLKSLRLIVLDEMHVYRGVFGSHVACVLRRLLRLCGWHHATPQIIACSATIGNPSDLFLKLTGREPQVIGEDGSPRGKRTFVFWNPPDIGAGRRLSANVVTSEIICSLADVGQRTLAFSRSRVGAELVLRYAKRYARKVGSNAADAIESYRAGYTPKERREIEKALFSGKLLALSATNAMELGVDVGSLDAVVMNGYPGSATSFWQQAGRAGRGVKDGLAVLVAHEDPLEQFLVREPSSLLESKNENVAINPENHQILSSHLLCAAQERPISFSELEAFGGTAVQCAESLDRSGELAYRNGLFLYPSVEPPASKVSIRGAGSDTVRLMVGNDELGTMERWRAMMCAHEGAVYLHRDSTFLVTEFDVKNGISRMEPAPVNYYTQAIVRSILEPGPAVREVGLNDAKGSLLGVRVTDLVDEFRKRSLDGDTVLGVEPLDLPPESFETVAVRFDIPSCTDEKLLFDYIGGVHGCEHALMSVTPLLAGCDRTDLGSSWFSVHPDSLAPAIFVFDRTPGGVGLCERLFEGVRVWIETALKLLTSCPCPTGCPSCLMSPRCESSNEYLHKGFAVRILKSMTS